jgi:hypothetical protein
MDQNDKSRLVQEKGAALDMFFQANDTIAKLVRDKGKLMRDKNAALNVLFLITDGLKRHEIPEMYGYTNEKDTELTKDLK